MSSKIGAYQRISFDGEGDGLGVARQLEDTHKLAEIRGWSIIRDYTDNNFSAFKKHIVRPQFEQMILDLKAGIIDGIVAYDLDRIARQPSDLERLIAIYEDHAELTFATVQGDIDLAGEGITMARIMVAFANKSSRDTSRRIKRKLLENAQEGKPHGSPIRPYGYSDNPMILDPQEAHVLKLMGSYLKSGFSYYEIAKRLTELGLPTRAGKPWEPSTIRKHLTNPRHAGFRVLEGVKYKGKWEHVFEDDDWLIMQAIIQRRHENIRGRPNNSRYLLTRLLKCKKCGGDLFGMTKRDASSRPLRRTYQCRGCNGMCIGADPLDHFIRESVIFRLDSELMGEVLQAQKSEGPILLRMLEEQRRLKARIDVMFDSFVDGKIDKRQFAYAQDRLNQKITVLQRDIDSLYKTQTRVSLKPGETIRDAWNSNPDGWRRELTDMFIEKIDVDSSDEKPYYTLDDGSRRRFAPSRITIKWKI
ncbi:recombinase family protein [Cryobacterium sp. GrIS_2_6]|uniref:recombinase family protein n=1 Tax=Cryobacterium sp. GrIS_2_6 TaxID=3162785 RepID=UPI002E079504|nr:DNA invertase Pin-like site-specific DNA recombinase [Cryobacterium psychrotolerans]